MYSVVTLEGKILADSPDLFSTQRRSPTVPPKLNESKLNRVLDKYPDVTVVSSFAKASTTWKTRSQWWRQHDRKVVPNERPQAIVLWEHPRRTSMATIDPFTQQTTWSFHGQKVIDPITVFSIDQTKPVRKHARTKAYDAFWQIFGKLSHPKYKIALHESGDWKTWRGKITDEELRGHVSGLRQLAVRASEWTRFIGIDLDLHSGDRDVFLPPVACSARPILGP